MPTECMDCERPADKADNRIVDDVHGEYGPVCNECWSIFLHQDTVLSEREADVAALRDMGITPKETADILELEESTVYTYLGRIHRKVEKAHRTVDEIGYMTTENDWEGPEFD